MPKWLFQQELVAAQFHQIQSADGQHHMTVAVVAVDEVGSATHVTLTSRTREGLGGGGEAEEQKEFITKGLQQ